MAMQSFVLWILQNYDEKFIAPGATLPLYFNVTINGWNAIEKFEVDILDESGTVIQSGEVSCGISPGDTVETSFNYKLPSIVQNQSQYVLKINSIYSGKKTYNF